MGVKGEEEFGRRHFETVVSTFDAPLKMTVLYGQKELGNVDPMSLRQRNEGPSVLILAGRYWRVVSQDWDSKIVRVEPSEDKGKAAWFGSSKSLGFDLCRMIQSILIDRSIPATLTKRSLLKLDELAESFEFLKADKTVAVYEVSTEWRWWTFAGWNGNLVLADMCRQTGNKIASFDNFSIKLKHPLEPFPADILQLASQIDGDTEKKLMVLADKLKYSLCLPSTAQLHVLFCRLRNTQGARIISEISIAQV